MVNQYYIIFTAHREIGFHILVYETKLSFFYSAENELHEVKMEFKQFKDVEIDEVTKLKTQLDEAEKKNESTNDELKKKVEENVNLLSQ